jgi:hypothetical protein
MKFARPRSSKIVKKVKFAEEPAAKNPLQQRASNPLKVDRHTTIEKMKVSGGRIVTTGLGALGVPIKTRSDGKKTVPGYKPDFHQSPYFDPLPMPKYKEKILPPPIPPPVFEDPPTAPDQKFIPLNPHEVVIQKQEGHSAIDLIGEFEERAMDHYLNNDTDPRTEIHGIRSKGDAAYAEVFTTDLYRQVYTEMTEKQRKKWIKDQKKAGK